MSIMIAAKAASSTEGANHDIIKEKEMEELMSEEKKELTDTFWIGVYPGMTDAMLDAMADAIKEALV